MTAGRLTLYEIPYVQGTKLGQMTGLVYQVQGADVRCKTLFILLYSSMNDWWSERPTRTCDLGVSLSARLVATVH